jgi:hypothetical protein
MWHWDKGAGALDLHLGDIDSQDFESGVCKDLRGRNSCTAIEVENPRTGFEK